MAASDIEKLRKMVNDFKTLRDDIINGVFVKKIAKECVKAIADDIDYIFTYFIDEYYDSYTPKYYNKKRQYSLRDIYDITTTDDEIGWETPAAYTGWHRVDSIDSTYIYHKMFQ